MSQNSPRRIGIVGLGLLGRGIVACLLAHDKQVVAFSNNPCDFAQTRQHIDLAIRELITRAGFAESLSTTWPDVYIEASSIADLARCDFIIETVTENLEVKRDVLAELEAVIDASIPIATNTSGFSLSELQQSMTRPGRLVAMHWAEPAHATRFMELAGGDLTDPAAFAAALALAKAVGKDPCVLNREVEGLIVNRLAYAMYREAFHLLEMGVADVETIDRAFRNSMGLWASVAGPFRWMDLTGVGAYARVMRRLWPALSNATDVPTKMEEMVASGAQGITTGRGFYNYTAEEARHWDARFRQNAWRIFKRPTAS